MIAPGTRVHFVGIGGSGMSAIAWILLARGYPVSGSDLRETDLTRRLRTAGATIQIGHSAGHVAAGQVLVISRAVPEQNVEVQAARAQGVPIMHRAEMLAALMKGTRGIAIAGTHGKTTTTSMTAVVLDAAGRDPTVLIGGEVEDFGGNARVGDGPELVAEVDESDGSLLWVAPTTAVVTSVDATDHLDFYGSEARLADTFRTFLGSLAPDALSVICADAPLGRSLAQVPRGRVVTYGLEAGADYTARVLEMAGRRTVFEARRSGVELGTVSLGVPGRYNIQNALGALATATEIDVPFAVAQAALAHFRGVQRRFTVRGEVLGVLVVDDYAHNPTKVAALLEGTRQCWPDARIIAVFQPHRYTRTRTVGEQFGGAFAPADEVIVTDIYGADEVPIPGVDAGIVTRAIGGRRPVRYIADAARIARILEGDLRPGDLVLTIGAGDIWKVADELVTRLRHRASQRPRAREGAGG